jgi:DNA-binding PadR family transcriptional regulator
MADEKSNPLTPAVFHILLALSGGERHGYGIMKEVEADSQGKVKMGPGTLYGSIKRMLDAGLIAESGKKADPEMDYERRIYYKLTGAGEKALNSELERYRHLVELSRARALLTKEGFSCLKRISSIAPFTKKCWDFIREPFENSLATPWVRHLTT